MKCPKCGIDADEINRTGRLGCSHCYTYYSKELLESLDKMHKSHVHIGKVPKNYSPLLPINAQLENLEKEIQENIKSENFEQAALYRNAIQELKNFLKRQHKCETMTKYYYEKNEPDKAKVWIEEIKSLMIRASAIVGKARNGG